MSNELTRVIDAIKQDPHGETARNVCHWLAVNVMGWDYSEGFYDIQEDEHGDGIEVWQPAFYCKKETVGGFTLNHDIMDANDWQPLTDANHLGMICEKVGLLIEFKHDMPFKEFVLECTLDALRWEYKEGTLADELLKGF